VGGLFHLFQSSGRIPDNFFSTGIRSLKFNTPTFLGNLLARSFTWNTGGLANPLLCWKLHNSFHKKPAINRLATIS